MLLANERNHCMEVSVKKMKAIKDVWPSMALAIMHIANSYSWVQLKVAVYPSLFM
ncbi:hypothetical protein NC651_022277 [Populus alba x Populus x berolinensis]|nr:hypothetical protein NC651_022277 [Populus alba x Populus x berolinensis]